ncbi:MAG: helix-turn-helix transcriptional regulator [Allosphingosinicella sp.]|uniref:S24 family peptidase n=1 Tax=Allosphingosinicella sp. TaxID=2823234 RepID=UPI003961DDB5
MAENDPRAVLERLIEERGEDYAGLSRLIGRNPSYIQQYIKRGTPRRLAETDRRLLARYFAVDEELLGGPADPPAADGLVRVPRIDVGASAGAGAVAEAERTHGHIAFDPAWLRRLAGDPARLSLIRVDGHSMAPTLSDGDEILVDTGDAEGRLRDGIYVLRLDDALMVKRISRSLAPGCVSVTSDGAGYPGWPDYPLKDLRLVGRVVWAGRRIV